MIVQIYFQSDFSNMKETTLEFQNDKSREDDPLNFTKIKSLLSELESKSSPVMSKEVPALFSELVQRLKILDSRQMSHLYGSFKASNVWKFLIDAAPLVSTAASTNIMTALVKEGNVTTKEADIWYSSLAFVQNPDPDMFVPLTVSNLIYVNYLKFIFYLRFESITCDLPLYNIYFLNCSRYDIVII